MNYETHHDFMIDSIAGKRIWQNSCIIHFAAAKASKTTLLADACDSKYGVDFCDPFLQPLCGLSVLIVCRQIYQTGAKFAHIPLHAQQSEKRLQISKASMQAKCSSVNVEQQVLYKRFNAWLYNVLDLRNVDAHEEAKPIEHVHIG